MTPSPEGELKGGKGHDPLFRESVTSKRGSQHPFGSASLIVTKKRKSISLGEVNLFVGLPSRIETHAFTFAFGIVAQ